jgi:hypothetical protein
MNEQQGCSQLGGMIRWCYLCDPAPLQLDAIFNEETDVADANCLLDCVIRSEYAWDRDTPDKWWTDAFNTRRKAGGLLGP